MILISPFAAHATEDWRQEARKISAAVPPRLLKTLDEQIKQSGPEQAIPVCRDLAPEIAKDVSSTTGWQLRRVTLKPRNDKRATPDAWEKQALEEFEHRRLQGEKPAGLEKGEIVEENGARFYRYVKALPVQPLCLTCHGETNSMGDGIRTRLKETYPNDKATGYHEGEIRGAISLKKSL